FIFSLSSYLFGVKKMFLYILLAIFGQGNTLFSQNLTGIWKGYLKMKGCFSENFIELALEMDGSAVMGDSYHYESRDNYVKKIFTGNYNPATRKLQVQEGMITTYRIPTDCEICTKQFMLTYKKEDNTETLFGTWSGHISATQEKCSSGDIVLTRIIESA